MPIKSILARQIFDSRGFPTVEVDLVTDLGLFRAAVPSGASTGVHEALELRDQDAANYNGKSVFTAVCNVNQVIAPELIKSNLEVTHQMEIDDLMIKLDGTENKSKLGANAILGVSLAVAKAGAAKRGIPLYKHIADLSGVEHFILPVPSFNVINGGVHAGNQLAMQEFMIMPTGAHSFAEAMKMGSEVYHYLKDVIKDKFGLEATAVGDEGGFAPNITKAEEALDLITTAIQKGGYQGRIDIAMDPASSEFYKEGNYNLNFKAGMIKAKGDDEGQKDKKGKKGKKDKKEKKKKEKKETKAKGKKGKKGGKEDKKGDAKDKKGPGSILTGPELMDLYKSYFKKYPIVSLEDPFEQDDWENWSAMTTSTDVQIVADDLTVTNMKRIETAVERKAANCLLLKVNQVGSITEAIQAHCKARENGWGTMVSHRSGETEDTFIADLVVGLSTGQIKTGAPCRSERTAKYNQILRIEEELGNDGRYAGHSFRKPL
ncbi:hypothetical protein Zmor_025857 [Zophobas morio]|uniref:Enolase n=2 Tax=Zophobas morio TaxID=2755281 RepID=A0AA38HS82_9CUCU|nr:hypothetical protein Zmor_025857 [Zophobas morio]